MHLKAVQTYMQPLMMVIILGQLQKMVKQKLLLQKLINQV